MGFKFNKTEEPFGGVVEWFKALVLKTKNTYCICKRSERYLKKWPPIGGLIVSNILKY